jgi:hypothetical protein
MHAAKGTTTLVYPARSPAGAHCPRARLAVAPGPLTPALYAHWHLPSLPPRHEIRLFVSGWSYGTAAPALSESCSRHPQSFSGCTKGPAESALMARPPSAPTPAPDDEIQNQPPPEPAHAAGGSRERRTRKKGSNVAKGRWPFGRSIVSALIRDNPSLRTPGISYAP